MSGVTYANTTLDGNSLGSVGHVTLTIPGDTVTFSFRSDSSTNGYGYYAIVKYETPPEDGLINENDETEFEFTAYFSNMAPNTSFNSDIGRIMADEEGNAEKTFYLKNKQVISFNDVPVGTTYRFEEGVSSYIASYSIKDVNNIGRIVKAEHENAQAKQSLSTSTERVDSGEDITVLFKNTVEKRNLTVVVRTERISDTSKNFHFTVQARDENNAIAGTYQAILTHANGSKENIEVTFDGSGRTEFDLKVNENIKILSLPKGISYSVTQTDYSSEGISTSNNTQQERHTVALGSFTENE